MFQVHQTHLFVIWGNTPDLNVTLNIFAYLRYIFADMTTLLNAKYVLLFSEISNVYQRLKLFKLISFKSDVKFFEILFDKN